MIRRRYSEDFRFKVLTSIARGMSNREAGEFYNMPFTTLAGWRARARIRSGLPPAFKAKPPEVHTQAVTRYNSGEPARTIAKDLGVSAYSVYMWFRKYIREMRA